MLPGAAGFAHAAESSEFSFSVLPKSLQKRPLVEFYVVTEMTPEGRKHPAPTPGNPIHYLQQAVGKVLQPGSAQIDAKNPPPVEDLEKAMQRALDAAGYKLVAPGGPGPALMVVFNYGTHGIDPPLPMPPPPPTPEPMPPVTAEEWLPIIIQQPTLLNDVIDRANLIGGVDFAVGFRRALEREVDNQVMNQTAKQKIAPESPDAASPFQMYLRESLKARDLVEQAFHTVYFVVASAYDYAAMLRGQRLLLWRTKMTVDAQGVAMNETLLPLIASATPYFGKDMKEFESVSKRISREGKVEIGTATVVEDAPVAKPAAPTGAVPEAPAAKSEK